MPSRADDPRIPVSSAILGYGSMLPLVVSAITVWIVRDGLALLAVRLAVIWGALLLTFVGGVRRGFGFGNERASTPGEIAASIACFTAAGLALVSPRGVWALLLLALGFAAAGWLDRRAALAGNAPAHFARLRPVQMGVGSLSLAALWAWLTAGGIR